MKAYKGKMTLRQFEGLEVRANNPTDEDKDITPKIEEDSEYRTITGAPIVYDRETVITEPDGFQYIEVIKHGAVQEGAITRDTALFYNHDLATSKPLARVRTGKLRLTVTDSGVSMEADINIQRSDAKDLYIAIKDGDITGMSFMFRVEEDEWSTTEQGMPKRIIKKIGYIHEVSAVADPAYKDTAITARSGESVETLSDAVETARAKYTQYIQDKGLALAKRKAKAKLEI